MLLTPPMPENELERIVNLSEFDLDYSDLQDNFKELTKLAAHVAGTDVSLVNLIDSFTQWTVSNYGHSNDAGAREDSACQYTIVTESHFEVKDLSKDERFKDKDYVTGAPHFRYYFGVPLTTGDGYNIGALCVLDKLGKEISPEKVELLKTIANEIVSKMVMIKLINGLRNKITESRDAKNRVAHDIRGPLGGILSLAEYVKDQGDENKLEELLEFMTLIQKSAGSLLELAEEILDVHAPKKKALMANEFNLQIFKTKLEQLYQPQAMNKNIDFAVNVNSASASQSFSKNKLLQIAGNLISNAMKFTPEHGFVHVDLHLTEQEKENELQIVVKDSGVGLSEAAIDSILNGSATTTGGTNNEKGYGFGLALIKHLVEGMGGTIAIHSKEGEGAAFKIQLPQRSN